MKKYFLHLLFFSVLLNACSESRENRSPADPERHDIAVIGHAGSGFLYPLFPFNPYPPNSMASLEKALLKNKADGVEIDLQMTKDGRFVLFHDPHFEVIPELEGCVSEMEAAEIIGKKYDTGFFYNLFHSEEIISFDQFLVWFSTLDREPLLHLDLKNFDACMSGSEERAKEFAQKLYANISSHNFSHDKIVFGSSDKNMLMHLKSLDADLVLMLDEGNNFEAGMEWCLQNGIKGLITGHKRINKENIEAAHKNNLQVVVFGGRSSGTIKEIVEMKPDAIQVNNVAELRSLLD